MKNIKKRSNKYLVGLFIVCFSIIPLIGCSNNSLGNAKAKESLQSKSVTESIVVNEKQEQVESEEVLITDTKDSLEENKLIEVDGGNQSGDREPNVIVDIGFGDREYYAFTNEYGQLVKVTAKEIILQDDSTEPVTSKGRYYSDEAKVPGVESSTLDEGHVIADSLGGVSNAYNITPQNSTLNRHGDQAYMEKVIRDAGGCTDFTAVITYLNTTTQIPNHYSFTYTLKGNVINDEFDNVNSDEVNKELEETNVSIENQTNTTSKELTITALDKKAELVTILNNSNQDIDMTGWILVSVTGNQRFIFPQYTLEIGSSVTVGGYDSKNISDFDWEKGRGIWNNSKSDPAELYDASGNLIFRFND